MLTEKRWLVTVGVKRGRGGWQINGQHIVHARGSDQAFNLAYGFCDRGEQVLSIEDVDYDYAVEHGWSVVGSAPHQTYPQ